MIDFIAGFLVGAWLAFAASVLVALAALYRVGGREPDVIRGEMNGQPWEFVERELPSGRVVNIWDATSVIHEANQIVREKWR